MIIFNVSKAVSLTARLPMQDCLASVCQSSCVNTNQSCLS
jgi:hypothetical protein